MKAAAIIGLTVSLSFTNAVFCDSEISITKEESSLCHDMSGIAYHIQRNRIINKISFDDFVLNYNNEYGENRQLIFAIAHRVYSLATVWDNPGFVGSSLHSNCLKTFENINSEKTQL